MAILPFSKCLSLPEHLCRFAWLLDFLLLVYISVDAGFAHGISHGDLISVLNCELHFSAVVPSHEGVSAAANLTQLCTRKRVVLNLPVKLVLLSGSLQELVLLTALFFAPLYIASFAFNVER